MPKVDIVVPCYNYGRLLTACVRSVLEQSVRDIRVLIIDDASTDDTAIIAKRIALTDSRVTVRIHDENHGHIRTYNEGIDWVESDYFLLLSADDLLIDGAFERAVAIMDANPDVGLTYGEEVVWFDHLPPPKIEPIQAYKWEKRDIVSEICQSTINSISTPTVIIRTSVQKAVGGYSLTLPHSGDMEMWLRLATNSIAAHIDAPQAIYRKHEAAMSNAYFRDPRSDLRQCHDAFESFFKTCGEIVQNADVLRLNVKKNLAQRAFFTGSNLIRQGHFEAGVNLLREATKIYPSIRYFPPIWYLFKPPGAHGRRRVAVLLKNAVTRVLGYINPLTRSRW